MPLDLEQGQQDPVLLVDRHDISRGPLPFDFRWMSCLRAQGVQGRQDITPWGKAQSRHARIIRSVPAVMAARLAAPERVTQG